MPRKGNVSTAASTSSGLVVDNVDQAEESVYYNISQYKTTKKWGAWLSHGNKRHYIGSWDDQELAARAQDRAALKLKGPETKTIFNPRDYKDDKKLWAIMGDTAFVEMLVGESRNYYNPTPKSKCLIRILQRRSEMGAAPVDVEPAPQDSKVQGLEIDQDEDSEKSLECVMLRDFRKGEGASFSSIPRRPRTPLHVCDLPICTHVVKPSVG